MPMHINMKVGGVACGYECCVGGNDIEGQAKSKAKRGSRVAEEKVEGGERR